MKQPRLPGAEKFKFASSSKPNVSEFDMYSTSRQNHSPKSRSSVNSSSTAAQFYSSRSSPTGHSNDSNTSLTHSVPCLNRTDSKRRPVLPITCKKTSRMLNNTNLELNVDHADLISEEAVKSVRHHLDASRVPSCPNLETSSRSLTSSKTSLDTYFRKMSLQNPAIRETPNNFDWKKIRASPSRLSASCSSSCSSEENVWVLREAD